MKRITKLTLGIFIGLAAIFTMSSCTNNFCSNEEKARIMFAIDPGVSDYFATEEEANASILEANKETSMVEQISPTVWRTIQKDSDAKYTKSSQLNTIITNASNASNYAYQIPSTKYFRAFDYYLLTHIVFDNEAAFQAASLDTVKTQLVEKGFGKFYSNNPDSKDLYDNYTYINEGLLRTTDVGYGTAIDYKLVAEELPTTDFVSIYQSSMNSTVSNTRSCIAVKTDEYGAYGKTYSDKVTIKVTAKSWSDAWGKGFIEGLIVYPVAWLVETFSWAFAGQNAATFAQGWPQLLSLILVTVIVRLFIFLCSFKSTLSQQKMNQLQPELTKIQNKYPNANTNRAEKQRLSEEQMKLYKKHKINPLSQLLILVIQFPVFIGVWGAMTGSASLSTGSVLNLNLSTTIQTALFNTSGLPSNTNGWWTALVLFILMAIAQFFSMKIPQWVAKAKTKKVAKLGKNPAQNQQNKTMQIVSWVMLVMIIVMGFSLPAAMGVYWFIGALLSIAQSFITQAIVNAQSRRRKE